MLHGPRGKVCGVLSTEIEGSGIEAGGSPSAAPMFCPPSKTRGALSLATVCVGGPPVAAKSKMSTTSEGPAAVSPPANTSTLPADAAAKLDRGTDSVRFMPHTGGGGAGAARPRW